MPEHISKSLDSSKPAHMRDDPPWLILGSDVHLGVVQTNRLFHRQTSGLSALCRYTPEFNPDFFASTVSDADCFF